MINKTQIEYRNNEGDEGDDEVLDNLRDFVNVLKDIDLSDLDEDDEEE